MNFRHLLSCREEQLAPRIWLSTCFCLCFVLFFTGCVNKEKLDDWTHPWMASLRNDVCLEALLLWKLPSLLSSFIFNSFYWVKCHFGNDFSSESWRYFLFIFQFLVYSCLWIHSDSDWWATFYFLFLESVKNIPALADVAPLVGELSCAWKGGSGHRPHTEDCVFHPRSDCGWECMGGHQSMLFSFSASPFLCLKK